MGGFNFFFVFVLVLILARVQLMHAYNWHQKVGNGLQETKKECYISHAMVIYTFSWLISLYRMSIASQ